jgi:hypothetical protein
LRGQNKSGYKLIAVEKITLLACANIPLRMIFEQLAMATPYEILALYANSDRSLHGLFARGYDCTRSPV